MNCMEMYIAAVASTMEMASLHQQARSRFLLGSAQRCLVTQGGRVHTAPKPHRHSPMSLPTADINPGTFPIKSSLLDFTGKAASSRNCLRPAAFTP